MQLKPLGNNIIFIFLEDNTQGRFIPSTGGQIILSNNNYDQQRDPKWGKVFKVGPDVNPEIKVGEYIMIEPLMWSFGFEFDGIKFWKTDDAKVLVTSEVPVHSF